MSKVFRGSYGVTVTPFTADGKSLDEGALKRFLDWQIEAGSPGVIILGTTGEFLTISDEERTQYVEATVKHVAGRMDVLVGTMNASTPNAVRYPGFFSFDSRVSKDFKVNPKYSVRISVSNFNLTNHFNPEAIHNNIADPAFGLFFGQRGRRFTGDFDVLF